MDFLVLQGRGAGQEIQDFQASRVCLVTGASLECLVPVDLGLACQEKWV